MIVLAWWLRSMRGRKALSIGLEFVIAGKTVLTQVSPADWELLSPVISWLSGSDE